MTVREIARLGEAVLRERAEAVLDPTAPEIAALALDMIDTMIEADGIGLAAPQVRVPLRVIVFYDRFDEGEDAHVPIVLCNPYFEPLDDALETGEEGCLSIPGLRGPVPRFARIRYSGLDLDGEQVEAEAEGLHARVVQHEIDHLDGVVYLERMEDVGALAFSDIRNISTGERPTGEGETQP
ncbi:peptide deformylase [Marinivivus vitaminiproducens]|uniref:peptide deformylase n=1 Tax=Marinivivus vitaminiproducens TaxID=3035935 RepID=UPI0027A0E986|nr:peptide deformylase [Geminicoccaceae bacterium SCSIO 64248]